MEEPLHQNILACLGTLVYIKTVIGASDFALARGWLSSDISRKIIHVAAGSVCLFWPYFDTRHVTWQLNVAIPAVYSVQLFVKGLILQDPNDPDVKTMSRSGKPIELCFGPLLFTFVLVYCGLYEFRTELGIYMLAALGYGDGIAPLFGKRWPILQYPTFGINEYKSLGGSLAFFVSTLLGTVLLRAAGVLESSSSPSIPDDVSEMLKIAAVATAAEAATGKWDNPAIAAAVYFYGQARRQR